MALQKRLLLLTRQHWGKLGIALSGFFLTAILNLVTPEIVRRLVSSMEVGIYDVNVFLRLSVILVSAYVLRAAMRFVGMAISHVAAWKFVAACTLEIYSKLQSLSMKYYQNKRTGDLMSRAINDTRQLELLIAHALPDFISNMLIISGVSVILLIMNTRLALFMMIPAPFVVLVSTLFSKKVTPLFRINQRVLGELNATMQDSFSGMREIQSFNQGKSKQHEMSEKCDEYANVNIRANYASAIYHPGIEFLSSLGTVTVVGAGGFMAARGEMPIADIVGFVMYLSLFYAPLTVLVRLVEDVQMSYSGASRVFEVLDEISDVRDESGSKNFADCYGGVSYEDVCFSYIEGEPVLNKISFRIDPGEMVSFVGPTGSGKTTIALLLDRFYNPDSGTIKIDGYDIKNLTVQSIRENISMVFQDTFLFNGTIAENISLGVPGASMERIEEASRVADAHNFINEMSDGYQTVVGERGTRLSGGQKQRIAIARAILRDTPILIFDEATSAVDTDTESEIQTAINKLAGSRTIIIIAHRLATVANSNRIYVLEKGTITETGSPGQLLKKGGLYARMHKIQLNS